MAWKSRRDFEAFIIAKSWEDPEFKAKLLKDPKSVVEELSGEKLPDNMKIEVIEETSNSVCLVLPKNPDDELDEAQLEQITGGLQMAPEDRIRYISNVFNRF